MLKKLLIPCFIFAASVAIGSGGCGSSSSSTGTGGSGGSKAGSGGSTAGTTGTGGATAGTTGTGGATGGTGGATAGTTGTGGAATDGGAGTTGTGGATSDGGAGTTGTGGSDAGGTDSGGSDTGATVMACPTAAKESSYTGKLDAVTFCENFLANCTGITGFTIPTNYATEAACETSWNAETAMTACKSYHLCGNAVGKALDARTMHCPHALGMGGACM